MVNVTHTTVTQEQGAMFDHPYLTGGEVTGIVFPTLLHID